MREIIQQWANAILSGRGKTERKWPRSSYEKSRRQHKNATLGDFTLRTEMLHPSALRVYIYGVPLLPDNPSLWIALMAVPRARDAFFALLIVKRESADITFIIDDIRDTRTLHSSRARHPSRTRSCVVLSAFLLNDSEILLQLLVQHVT